MTDWLIDCLIGWFIDWSADSLIHCFVPSQVHWFIDSSVHWLIDSLSQLCMDSFMSFHWHLNNHVLIRSCTSQFQLFVPSAFQNLPRGHPLSIVFCSKLPPYHVPRAGHYLVYMCVCACMYMYIYPCNRTHKYSIYLYIHSYAWINDVQFPQPDQSGGPGDQTCWITIFFSFHATALEQHAKHVTDCNGWCGFCDVTSLITDNPTMSKITLYNARRQRLSTSRRTGTVGGDSVSFFFDAQSFPELLAIFCIRPSNRSIMKCQGSTLFVDILAPKNHGFWDFWATFPWIESMDGWPHTSWGWERAAIERWARDPGWGSVSPGEPHSRRQTNMSKHVQTHFTYFHSMW